MYRDYLGPFRVALGGLIHAFRTQRHMRIHLYVTLLTIATALFLHLGVREILLLLFVINLVLITEMFNSVVESIVDFVSPQFHPNAKIIKDLSAGAVLLTTIMALIAGVLILLGDQVWERLPLSITMSHPGIPVIQRIVLGLFILFILVVVAKGLGKRGQVFQGGLVSGHAAIAFFLAGTLYFLTNQMIISTIGLLLAFLIAQSRYEAKFHSVLELLFGAIIGVLLSVFLFGLPL